MNMRSHIRRLKHLTLTKHWAWFVKDGVYITWNYRARWPKRRPT